MQTSYPNDMTPEQAALVGKLRREYFTDEAKMGHRREELRVQGEKVEFRLLPRVGRRRPAAWQQAKD